MILKFWDLSYSKNQVNKDVVSRIQEGHRTYFA